MKNPLLSVPLTLLLTLLTGCQTAPPREITFVLDISQSIDRDANQQMFAAVENFAQQLHRGDVLTVIPITGNTLSELPGRTLHYIVPAVADRHAYDSDLRGLQGLIQSDLARLQADAVAHPGKHTDIIGSVRVATMEFTSKPTDKWLVVLSDFIQEDSQFNFRTDSRLESETSAASVANSVRLLAPHAPVRVYLGRLKSSEFSSLTLGRQRAINAFWEALFEHTKINPDGAAGFGEHN